MAVFRWKAWLQLLRLPNLFTVPGDPWAGFFLASGPLATPSRAGMLASGAALCLYMGGLLLNDFADREVDRNERPKRPLPSGGTSPGAVLTAAMALMLSGLGLALGAGPACGWLAASLACLIGSYNFFLKARPILGPVAMGGCRAMSLMLGALAVEQPDGLAWAVVGGLIVFLYIAAVTQVARGEMTGRRIGSWAWGPGIVLGLGMGMTWMRSIPGFGWAAGLAFLPSAIIAFQGGWRARRPSGGTSVPGIIGQWIGAIILLQAALIWAAAPGNRAAQAMALLGLVLWICNRATGRWFYAS
jgi:4-hydroxybenzoate polyprenyltransferase